MFNRQWTRIDTVRQYVDEMLKACEDSEAARCGYVHLYGVGQACALIALRRGHDRTYAELAEIAGMLHDYATYKDNTRENHALRSSVQARAILTQTGEFTSEETDMICQAISRHSDKGQIHEEMDEILKDADAMQHWLRNPMEEFFFAQERVRWLSREFQLTTETTYKITIDGTHFSTVDEFYDEIDRLLTRDLTWKTGHNMDAFHDLLRGGFGVHEVGEGIAFYWAHSNKSRRDLGYEATVGYWEKILQKCHPANRERVAQKIKAAKNREGETVFDIITRILLNKEDIYDHTLILDNED